MFNYIIVLFIQTCAHVDGDISVESATQQALRVHHG